MPGFVGQEIRTKFGVIALSQNIRSQVARTCELLHVVTIAFDIPFQFGEGQIMGLKREEPQATPRTGEHGHQSFLVILGRRGDGDSVQVDFVLSVQGRPRGRSLPDRSARSAQRRGNPRRWWCGRSRRSESLRSRHSNAVERLRRGGSPHRRKGSPRLRRLCRITLQPSSRFRVKIAPALRFDCPTEVGRE